MPNRPNPYGPGFVLQATRSTRGDHPDLANDDPEWHLKSQQQREDAEFDARWTEDETFRKNYIDSVTERQRRLPADIAREVSGRHFPGTPSEGIRAYESAVRTFARQSNSILESDIAGMSAAEYARYFSEGGQVRPGYRVIFDKSQPLSDIADLAHRTHYQSAGFLKDMTTSALKAAETQAANQQGTFIVDRRAAGPVEPYREEH